MNPQFPLGELNAALPGYVRDYDARPNGGVGHSSSEAGGAIMRFLTGLLAVIAVCNLTLAQTDQTTRKASLENSQHMSDFQAFEFRRYAIKESANISLSTLKATFPKLFSSSGQSQPVPSSSAGIDSGSLGLEVSTRLKIVPLRTQHSIMGPFGKSIRKR